MVKIHNTQNKILKFFLSNKLEEFTIRSIAKNIAVDYKSVYLVINELVKKKIIRAKKIGQAVLCSINQKRFNADVFRVETIRKEELLKNKTFSILCSYFDIQTPFFVLLLFGSQASGKTRKGSDIDLMLITDEKKIVKQIKDKISLIPLNIHLLDFTSAEFLSMIKTTKFNVGKEALNNNIILFGIENYYGLIKNA